MPSSRSFRIHAARWATALPNGAALPDVAGFDGATIVVVIPFERTEEAKAAA